MSRNIVGIVQFLLLISIFKETLSDEFRLPKHVVPKNYNLKIIPNFDGMSYDYGEETEDNFAVEGIAIIQMNCLIGGSKNITLNAINLNVTSYNLTDDKGKNITIQSLDIVDDKHFLVFNLTETLNVTSNYSLFLKYQSSVSIDYGYSPSDDLYYTSLPLINARRVFPCFDEPEFKATFDLTLARKPKMHTLSNMPHKNISLTKPTDTALVYDEFETTPNMSTHVLAFYISTFSNKTAPNISNVDIKMWAPDNLLMDNNEILQKAAVIYNGLEKYLNSTQPIRKQDLVYTNYYTHEGADSWGLIHFAPDEMYIGNKSLPYDNEKNLIDLAHKLSHQWLGNLVTPSWWSDLWVSEGTSTFMSYFVLQKEINKIWNKFSFDVFQDMLTKDSRGFNTVSLKHEVTGDLTIFNLFLDVLSGKGACITRMMMKTFGEEEFKKGIQYFLKEFSFKNVEEDDLWSSLQMFVNNTNISVKDIMSGWTTLSGYPLVTVNVSEMCRHIVISQKQFFDRKKNDTRQLWAIPLKYQMIYIDNQTVVNRELIHIGKNTTTVINDSLIMDNTLVIANYELLGFFRVNYDMNNWEKIIKQLHKNHTIIDVLNRAQFMDDTFSFVGPSIENYTLGMRISQYLVNETEELPWLTFFKHLQHFYNYIILNNRNSEFMKHLKNVTTNIFKPWNETQLESLSLDQTYELKMQVDRWACLSGNENCTSWAIQAFNRWRNDTENGTLITRKIYKDRRYLRTIVCSKLRNTDNDTLIFVLNQMKINYALQSTIACVEKEDQIHLILNTIKNVYSTLPSLVLSSVGRQVMRKELRNMTDGGKLLDRDLIYSFLTLNLKKSVNETEFNKTESVFESIVSWPQVNITRIDPRFNLSAIKNHTAKIKLTWSKSKAIEQEVINAII